MGRGTVCSRSTRGVNLERGRGAAVEERSDRAVWKSSRGGGEGDGEDGEGPFRPFEGCCPCRPEGPLFVRLLILLF